jgi:hypothetical protein
MKINPNMKYQIKLTKADAQKFKTSIENYSSCPTQKLKMEVFNIYAPYIDSKVQADAYGLNIIKEDYKGGLYVTLLEAIETIRGRKFKSSNLVNQMLNEVSPTKDDAPTWRNHIDITETDVKAKEFSFSPEEQTPFQKIKDILLIAKDVLNQGEYEVLLKHTEGRSFSSIAALNNTSGSRTQQVYCRAIPKINARVNKTVLEEAFFDDKNTKRKAIPADEPLIAGEHQTFIPLKKTEKTKQELEADAVWNYVQQDMPPVNVFAELDRLLRTQTTSKELMLNVSAQTKLRRKLKQNPDFTFKLKLDRRCDNEDFRQKAAELSTVLFGKNVFEFV